MHLGGLDPTRDFLYVTDSVEGYLRAAVADAVVGQTINMGTGREISIGDLAQLIVRMTGGAATSKRRNGGRVPTQVRSNGCWPTPALLASAWGGRHRSAWKTDSPARSIGFAINPERFKPGTYSI